MFSCIDIDGTVIDRLFINQSKEKDLLKTKLNKLAKAKRKSGILNENLKPLSETRRLQVEANVPLLADRTSHTLSSLIKLREVY